MQSPPQREACKKEGGLIGIDIQPVHGNTYPASKEAINEYTLMHY